MLLYSFLHLEFLEPPSKPGKPFQMPFFDASKEVLAIKWERPYTDGGSPIIGYLVEQRRVGSPIWTKLSATLIPCIQKEFMIFYK